MFGRFVVLGLLLWVLFLAFLCGDVFTKSCMDSPHPWHLVHARACTQSCLLCFCSLASRGLCPGDFTLSTSFQL